MARTMTTSEGTPRETILRVATNLFGKSSYPATSMRDIAKEVGILAGSLYAHIDSKETLLLEIIEQGITEFLEAVQTGMERGGSAEEQLHEMILEHIRVVAKNPGKTQTVFHQWRYLSEDNQRSVRELRRRYEELFTNVVEAGVRDGTFADDIDVRVTVLSLLGSLNWTPEWLAPEGPTSMEEISRRLSDAILKGLLGR